MGIDIFGVPFGEPPDFDNIILDNGLGVLLPLGLRSNDSSGFPTTADSAVLLDLYRKVAEDEYEIIGRMGISKEDFVDIDGNGIEDIQDNCLLIFNPLQTDPDSDGYGLPCDADLDNSGTINFLDVAVFSQAFLSAPGDSNWNPNADFDNSGVVNFIDYASLTERIFMPPGPSGTRP